MAGPSYPPPAPEPFTAPAPVSSFGEGLYFALHGGLNAYQSYEGTGRATTEGGESAALEFREKVGGYGGIKIGYGWGGGAVKPAIEFDGFYNAVDFAADARLDGKKFGSATGRNDTGAFLINGILRFETGSNFSPYVGAGAGFWVGQTSDFRISGNSGSPSLRVPSNDNATGFAWQLMAGFDYFMSERMSFFSEYKWLNYQDVQFGNSEDRTGQHLVGVGIRWFF
jgi:opacity protein-like surface antigen